MFTRTCDLQGPSSVFGQTFIITRTGWVHTCTGMILQKNIQLRLCLKKTLAWNSVVEELNQGLKTGKGYELSVIRDNLNNKDESCNFCNRDVKTFLMNHFGVKIDFTYPGA